MNEQTITIRRENTEQSVAVLQEATEKTIKTNREGVLVTDGKIDSISVNGVPQEIVDRNVDITVPTTISELINDSNYVSDANYTHTDNNFTTALKEKLEGVEDGAQENVIENIKVNNVTLTVEDKTVDISVPTSTSQLVNDSGFVTDVDLSNYYTKSEADNLLDDKVDKVAGKGLSTEDFTTAEKTKLANIESGAQANVNADWNATSGDAAILNKPHIPENTSDLNNDSGFIDSLVTDLGDFDAEDYDWDFWAYAADITEPGTYKAREINDNFGYFLLVERTDNGIRQEYWYDEESSDNRHSRSGYWTGSKWEFNDPVDLLDSRQISDIYYNKSVIDNKFGNYYTDVQVDDILDNNYYTSDTIDDMFDSFHPVAENMIETTWANLVQLRDNAQLVRGAYYRITDYNFITTKLGIQSGNHQFDIVLLAISESMLSENGYACRHAGDHYFEREVTEGGIEWLYSLYVDDYGENYGTEPIDHADDIHLADVFCDSGVMTHPDTGDDVPVLYKTDSEEYTIDDPDYDDVYFYSGVYDFDGDEYDMWAKYERDPNTDDWIFKQQYALTPIVVEDGELIVSPIPETKLVPVNMNAWELKYCLDNDKELFDWAATDGKGVIYYLKDEFGNEAPYDFKNVMFQRKNITSVSNDILSYFTLGENSHIGLPDNYGITCGNDNYYYYTFDTPENVGNDSSLFGDSAYNIIKPRIFEGKRVINNIVLGFANNNNIGNGCYDLTIWGSVTDNNLEHGCWNLLIVSMSQSTMSYVRSSTFYSLGTVTFDNGCNQNIGNMLTNFTLGESCRDNNLGKGSTNIRMGNNCSNNTFGNYCASDNLETGVINCKFGNYCSYNNFGIAAQNITLPNYVRYCNFESSVSKITITASGGNTLNYVQYVTVCSGVTNKTLTPARKTSYEQIYYKTGRVETAV